MFIHLIAALLAGTVPGNFYDEAQLVTISIAYELKPYRVEGSSLREVLKSIEERGPKDQHGIARHAYSGWNIRWSWLDGRRDPKVKLNLTLIHPVWDGSCAEWGRYMGALLKHEMNHLRFAVNTAKEIKETIYNSRNLTDKQLQQRLGYLIQKNQEFDFEYDQETRNGLHEGVSLDPNAC